MSGIARPILLDIPTSFEGARIRLRLWEDADAAAEFAAVTGSRERLRVWLPWVAEYHDLDDAREFVRLSRSRFLRREECGWGLFARDDGRVLGGIGLRPHDWAIPAFEIGYWLATAAEGHGYMSEAVRLLTAFAFDALGAQRVMIRCDARNARSRAVPERLGFVHEATLRNDCFGTDGALRDTLVWAMIPEDYARARPTWPSE